jgi:hypothetical protein
VARVADPGTLEWHDGVTEGIAFRFQTLLAGEAGPEAIRLAFGECPSVYAHMHLVAQFQVVLDGTMVMPRGITLRPYGVQYTDGCVPYGPFATTAGHDMLVLHARPGGLLTMADHDFRRHINLNGRLLLAQEDERPWVDDAVGSSKTLIPSALGPEVELRRLAAGDRLMAPQSAGPRYEVVLAGSLLFDGRAIDPPGLRFIEGDERVADAVAGPNGATAMSLVFDATGRRGHEESDVLAMTARDAMAAIL